MSQPLDNQIEFRPACFSNYNADEICEMFDDVKNQPAAFIAKFYSHLRRLHDEMDAERKKLSKLIEHISMTALPEAFEQEGITSFTTDEGDRVTVAQVTRASVPAETKDEAYRWLKDNGFPDIVKETVHAGTLGSVAKSILAGEVEGVFDLPERLFKVQVLPQTSVTRTKKGKK